MFFPILIGQSSFPRMVNPLDRPISPWPWKEVTVHDGHKVLMEVGDSSASIICDPQGILFLQLKPHLIQVLTIILLALMNYQIIYLCYKIENHAVQRWKQRPYFWSRATLPWRSCEQPRQVYEYISMGLGRSQHVHRKVTHD